MRTITLSKELYTIDELSHSAKMNAWTENNGTDEYPWSSENKDTLKAFENIFPVKVKDWEYGYHKYVSFSFTEDDNIENLKGIRLMTYLYNNYSHCFTKGKYYSTRGYYDENKKYHYKKRYSKVMFENSCVLTGYCIDDDIMQPIYEFLKKPCENTSFYDLMEECLESWVTACHKDHESYFSLEHFEEEARENNWEFSEDGKRHY